MESGGTKNSALAKKAPTMPKPQWHPPWKLYRVSIGLCLVGVVFKTHKTTLMHKEVELDGTLSAIYCNYVFTRF